MIRGRNIDYRNPARLFGVSPVICTPVNDRSRIVSVSFASAIPFGSNLLDDAVTGVTTNGYVNDDVMMAAFRWPWCITFTEEDGASVAQTDLDTLLRVTGVRADGTVYTEDIQFDSSLAINQHETKWPYAILTKIELISSNFVSNRNIRIGFTSNFRSTGTGSRISTGAMFKDGTELLGVSTEDIATPLDPRPRAFTVNTAPTADRHADVPYGTFSLAAALYPSAGQGSRRGRVFLDPTKV